MPWDLLGDLLLPYRHRMLSSLQKQKMHQLSSDHLANLLSRNHEKNIKDFLKKIPENFL